MTSKTALITDGSPECTVNQVTDRQRDGRCLLVLFLFIKLCLFFEVRSSVWRRRSLKCDISIRLLGLWGVVGFFFFFVPLCWMTVASLVDLKPETHQTVFNCPVKPVKPVKPVHNNLLAHKLCECLSYFGLFKPAQLLFKQKVQVWPVYQRLS